MHFKVIKQVYVFIALSTKVIPTAVVICIVVVAHVYPTVTRQRQMLNIG